jgi:hypothetical protein
VEYVGLWPAELAVVPEPGPRRLEESPAWVESLDRQRQPMGQVDVVVIPDEEQVMRGQGHRGVGLLPDGPEPAGDVQDAHIGVLKDQVLLVEVVEHDQLSVAWVLL